MAKDEEVPRGRTICLLERLFILSPPISDLMVVA